MRLALFLHIYQPPTQFPEVLQKVILECYTPLVKILEESSGAKVTLNVAGSLLEQLNVSNADLVQRLRSLVSEGRIELVGSAGYHPLLTKIPEDEIKRQIELNEQILKSSLGAGGRPGFFPPEMAINQGVCQIVKSLGYRYILADESCVSESQKNLLSKSRVLVEEKSGLLVVVRNKKLSLDVAFSKIRTLPDLLLRTKNQEPNNLVLAMDGETFGHHRPEQMNFLRELLSYQRKDLELCPVSQIIMDQNPPVFNIVESSWGESFERWQDPQNPIHRFQWQLTNLAITTVENYNKQLTKNKQITNINPQAIESWKLKIESSDPNGLLDRALHSDQYWWASVKPCWHYKMVERGAKLLLEAVRSVGSRPEVEKAEELYNQITQTGLKLYGDTVFGC